MEQVIYSSSDNNLVYFLFCSLYTYLQIQQAEKEPCSYTLCIVFSLLDEGEEEESWGTMNFIQFSDLKGTLLQKWRPRE